MPKALIIAIAALGGAAVAGAAGPSDAPGHAAPAPESVYAPVAPAADTEKVNQGGLNLDLTVRYMTDYVYRGIDHSEVGGHEDAPNLQFDGALKFDLGKFPHPIIGLFANVYDSDPVSRFQEIRPYVGLELEIKPLTFTGGHTTYIYPERDTLNTGEFWGRFTYDDSGLFGAERPLLNPYAFAAYDYDLNNGWYFELGVQHEMPIEDTPLTLIFSADIAYILGQQQQFVYTSPADEGFQHYELGLTANYSLNTLLNTSRRFGQWTLQGYLFYTDGINGNVTADTQLWGGMGIRLQY